jgi:hypothetical protein
MLRTSMRKEVIGLDEMVQSIDSLVAVTQEEQEEDPSREPPAWMLMWFVTEVLRHSRTSITVLQVALAYLTCAKRELLDFARNLLLINLFIVEIHGQLHIAADHQAGLVIQIAGSSIR